MFVAPETHELGLITYFKVLLLDIIIFHGREDVRLKDNYIENKKTIIDISGSNLNIS